MKTNPIRTLLRFILGFYITNRDFIKNAKDRAWQVSFAEDVLAELEAFEPDTTDSASAGPC